MGAPELEHEHNTEQTASRLHGGQVVERLGNQTINQKVVGSIPGRA